MRRAPRGLSVLLGAATALGWPNLAAADMPQADAPRPICPICSRANEESAPYPAKAVTTLGRGAANALLGWTELIRQPAQEAKAGGNVLTGIGRGLSEGVMRTLSGVGELLTFWTPKVRERYLHFATDCPVCMGR